MSSDASAPAPAPATESSAPSGRRKRNRGRRRLRLIIAVVVALALVLGAATVGIGWYFSGVATEVSHEEEYPLTVLDVAPGSVTLPKDEVTALPGTWALAWKGGRAMLGPVLSDSPKTVVRKVTSVSQGTLTKGTKVYVDHWIYGGDPKSALGLDFQNVTYPSKLGPMSAWLVPGKTYNSTWVIGVHGHNADKLETMRALPVVHRLGLPMLSIAYRNDVGAPASPDGQNHLGDTEWNEVTGAIAYARAHGATGVVLYGWSMGGAMVMTALRKAADPAFVRGVALDSPVMDWSATLDKQGADRGLPGFVTAVAKLILQRRIGIDLDDFDQRPYAPRLKTPTLLFTTSDDEMIDNGPALTFAKTAPPGMVTHIATSGGHTEAWNVDPSAYEKALTDFLDKVE
ncbi:alpha/beta hydrolase family protein [Spirillospora sp. NPDC048911]|uniref:alpha/beta hydrolase family protein n=1 Tax=Spirillospora sp. NPDC048911 TaxID=3364527 RepID=UPI00370FB69D